jgi:membrane associated rhomboid family serine protease
MHANMPYTDDEGPPMFTYAMMAVYIAFFAAQFKQFDLTRFYSYPWRVADGEVWRLVTCTFLHGSVIHILFNSTLFFRFSSVIDHWLGPWVALGMYAVLATSSNAAQLLVSPAGVIGASGVVYGLGMGWLIGQCFVARRRARPWLIAAAVAAWALPVALAQRPVWEATLGHVPWVNRGYGLNPYPGVREYVESPDNQPVPGVMGFGSGRR